MTGPRPHRRRALTLLETLLAISLLALILLALHMALSAGVGTWRQCRDDSERHHKAWGAVRLIGEDLQRLAGAVPGDDDPVLLVEPRIAGEESSLLKLRTVARAAPGAVPMRIDYFFMPDGRGSGALIRRSAPARGGDADARYEILAAGLDAVSFRCFDGRHWTDRWNAVERNAPPRLVEVTIDAPDAACTHAIPVTVQAALIGPDGPEETP